MFRKTSPKGLTRLLLRGSAIALIAAFMPLSVNFTDNGVTIDAPAAHAKGGEGGQGGGGGNGGGNGNDGGAESAGGPGNGHGNGKGVGSANGVGRGNNHGATASALGALNAAHASPTARAHAAPTSRVGRVAATIGPLSDAIGAQDVVDALNATINDPSALPADVAAAQAALAGALADLATKQGVAQTSVEAAANKTVDQSVMDALADLLGL